HPLRCSLPSVPPPHPAPAPVTPFALPRGRLRPLAPPVWRALRRGSCPPPQEKSHDPYPCVHLRRVRHAAAGSCPRRHRHHHHGEHGAPHVVGASQHEDRLAQGRS